MFKYTWIITNAKMHNTSMATLILLGLSNIFVMRANIKRVTPIMVVMIEMKMPSPPYWPR
jgi:hypothetical protein